MKKSRKNKNEKVEAFIDDSRFPGGSKREIKKVYNLDVFRFDDGTFTVEGNREDVDSYIKEYAIIVKEDDYKIL